MPSSTSSETDKQWMRLALYHARQGLGRTAPNPTVGCVVVNNGNVVAACRTSDKGRPHAEASALQKAGKAAKGATVYVTLEPCSHHGKTPPCAEALVEAGVKRVVVGCKDLAPHVNGSGIDFLKDHGLDVTEGVLEEQCTDLVRGFFLSVNERRPLVTLKIASTLDGKIATSKGESKWITGEMARRYAHKERIEHDAILVGGQTVLADDPFLTARYPGAQKPLIRVILDSSLKIPLESKLVKSSDEAPLWVFYEKDKYGQLPDLESRGVSPFCVEDMYDLKAILGQLAGKGVTRLLVEGGATVHKSFLQAGFVDRLLWFRAPGVMGGDALDCIGDMNIGVIQEKLDFRLMSERSLGLDRLEIFEKGG